MAVRSINNEFVSSRLTGVNLLLFILVILQAACVLATLKHSARRGPHPEGPLQAAFKSAPGRFVTRITYLSKLIGIPSLAAFTQLELFRVYLR
ncbi:hypothetical protein DMB41_17120 [Pectobacterium carotovorum subsp. carotovorum]|nr:hypothetical protein DMB41_17120 [Pectobacterium carotovorum subsp. carotovorum]